MNPTGFETEEVTVIDHYVRHVKSVVNNRQLASAFIGTQAQRVAEQAVQLHGGMGVTDELPIGHGLKRIMLLSKLFGDPASGFAHYAEAA